MDIYDIDELGPTTGTVFQIFANNNQAIKINTLFDTGAMKSVMSLEMCKVFILPVARVGSGDPVRVLHLYTMITLDEVCSIYC